MSWQHQKGVTARGQARQYPVQSGGPGRSPQGQEVPRQLLHAGGIAAAFCLRKGNEIGNSGFARCQNFWAKSRPFDGVKNGFEKPFDRHLTGIKNLEIWKVAKSYEKSSFSEEKLLFRWQPKKDSNPHKQSQSLSCYLYTIRLFAVPQCLATLIVYNRNGAASSAFFRKIKKDVKPLKTLSNCTPRSACARYSVGRSAARSFSSARFSMRDT